MAPGVSSVAGFRLPENVTILPQTPQLRALCTIIRNKATQRNDFIFYSDRIIRLLVEEGLNHLPMVETTVETPTGSQYQGLAFRGNLCGVSIMRAGESMESALREVCKGVRIGKILIQRDEETAEPKVRHVAEACARDPVALSVLHYPIIGLFELSAEPGGGTTRNNQLFYQKLPKDIASRYCFLLDPMLATGGSAAKAIQVLRAHSVQEDQIVFLNLLAAPEGITRILNQFPRIRIITAQIDECLNDQRFIVPGLGDFGCRYFGTD